jgi:hypothetical protein
MYHLVFGRKKLKISQIGGQIFENIPLGWRGMDWIDLAQDWGSWALVNAVMNFRVP